MPTITNHKFIRDGVHMIRCWGIGKDKKTRELKQVMTEIVNPNQNPYVQPRSCCWSPGVDEGVFKGRSNTSGVKYR